MVDAVDRANQDVIGLSLAEEKELGEAFHKKHMKPGKEYHDPILEQRLRLLAEPLLKECRRKEIRYTITIVNDPTVNAYSTLGGYIYVNTGLLARHQSDAEIQSVLGHEIGHVDLGHAMRRFAYIKKVTEYLGTSGVALTNDLYSYIARGYSSEHEYAADAFAFKAMLKHGRTRDEALAGLRRTAADASEAGTEDAAPSPVKPANLPDAFEAALRVHFKTHPPAWQRVRRLEMLKLDPPLAVTAASRP
jgi:predicted Zn-dependent protease